MEFLSVAQIANLWGVSERSVRNYCAQGRIAGAILVGKTWNIPADAVKPARPTHNALLDVLTNEMQSNRKGGIYHKVQVLLTYNSNHIEGCRLTEEQTRYIFETNTIGQLADNIHVDDVIETANHFACINYVIANAKAPLDEKMIKTLHAMLKSGTADSRKSWFAVGEYKKLPNEVGGKYTCAPEDVKAELSQAIAQYNQIDNPTLDDVINFHHRFESIHPFQDGNGRVGRLIMLKQCLAGDIVPFIITDDLKMYYYRGLANWQTDKAYLRDTILTAQDTFKKYLDYFKIEH